MKFYHPAFGIIDQEPQKKYIRKSDSKFDQCIRYEYIKELGIVQEQPVGYEFDWSWNPTKELTFYPLQIV